MSGLKKFLGFFIFVFSLSTSFMDQSEAVKVPKTEGGGRCFCSTPTNDTPHGSCWWCSQSGLQWCINHCASQCRTAGVKSDGLKVKTRKCTTNEQNLYALKLAADGLEPNCGGSISLDSPAARGIRTIYNNGDGGIEGLEFLKNIPVR